MSSGEENRDDPFEDDAQVEKSRENGGRPARSMTFYQPLSPEDYQDSRYEPEEVSFFSRSSEERAEQAQRAAQRVRRRVTEEDSAAVRTPMTETRETDASEAYAPAYTPQPAPEPTPQRQEDVVPLNTGKTESPKVETPKPTPTAPLLDRALQAPAAAKAISPSPEPASEKSGSDRGSLLDRAATLSSSARRKMVPAEPEPPKVEKPSIPEKSLMDRMVDRPVAGAGAAEKSEPKSDKDTGKSASLMDRAMQKSAPEVKPADDYETFKPKSVLSAPPKPAVRGAAARAEAKALEKSAKRQLKTVVDAGISKPSAALAKKAAGAVPLAERMTELAKTKSAAQVSAKKPEPKVQTKREPKRTVTPEEAVFATPAETPPARKKEPTAAATPKPARRVSVAEPVVAAPAVAAPAAVEPLYADRAIVTPTSGLRTAKTKPFAPFEWMIASRYLGARKKEGFVSVIAGFSLVGIALGVATLIVVMAVMTGFRETLVTQIIGGSPHINVYAQSDRFENYDALADQIRSVDGVVNVTPVVQGQVLATAKQRHSGVIVRGLRKADLEQLIENANPEVLNGTLENFVEDKGVALGADLAAKLGLRVGDFITLISPDGDITPFQATPMPRVKDYRIIQTFKLGVQEIDYGVAFMPFEEAQIYFNKQKQADTLDVFVDDPQSVSANLGRIEPGSYEDNIFQSARSSISVNNWKNLNGRLIGAINLERQVMFVILTMIILVAALNIISGLVMLVKDKARDVAIMRTMGMARGSILRIFFICGSSIGVIGSLAGVALGVLFVWNIHAIQGFVEWVTGTRVWDPGVRAGIAEIPTKLQFSDVSLTLFIALGLSFVATLFPAWKAAKLDPVEALRYE